MAARQPRRSRRTAGRKRATSGARDKSVAQPRASAALRDKLPERLINVTVKKEIQPAAARAAGVPATISIDEHRDDVAEVELASGGRFYTRLDQFAADFAGAQSREAAASGRLVIPSVLSPPTAERGVGEWAIKTLRLLGIDPIDTAAKLTGEAVCTWYERKQLYRMTPGEDGAQRLWRVGDGDAFNLEPIDAAKAGTTPLLVFLHGTASSTRGSFGELWAPSARVVRNQILAPYRGNVYAFEHFSLTQSPMQNALELLDALPDGATLHLVSHSRGGLIGELLCRGQMAGGEPFDNADIDRLFAQATHAQEAKQLRELARRLKDKKLRIERFARVACPARGTILVSQRLDRWLSLSLDAIGTIADLASSGYYAVFEEFVKAFVRTRADPNTLPGLEAMMPTSPIVRLLNREDAKSRSDLHVVAGDIEGGDLWRRLGILLTDLYYREDHDLVVNTRAMYGGTPRVDAPRRYFAQGPGVYHFTYFRNADTAAKVADALHRPLANDGFAPFDSREAPIPRGYRAPAPSTRGAAESVKPIVFVLPGIMGSCLDAGGQRIWVDIAAINHGGMERLAIDADGVTATALMPESYAALVTYLEGTHDVVPFPFDWRLSLRAEAKRLAAALRTWLDEADRRGQPLALIAHSLGGLLARVMIAQFPDLWERIVAKPQGRLVLLGTPNGGSHAIPLMLLGREPLVQGLALVDFKHSQRKLIELIGRFPGVLELLPVDTPDDFFDADLWRRLALLDDNGRAFWAPPDAATLAGAKALRAMLDRATPRLDRVIYVAGHAPRTPWQLHLDRPPGLPQESEGSARPPDNFYFENTPEGDGRVPWSTGVLPGLRPWYMDAVHGDLAATPEHFDALLELVDTGTTDKLPTAPPVTAKRDVTTEVFRSEVVPYVPDAQTLESAALGRSRRRKVAAAALPAIDVAVAHGNLVFARSPVFVGHYQRDSITSAEAQIDKRLGRRLSAHRRLGLYPGPLGSAEVFGNAAAGRIAGPDFPGAVVVGLGEVGALTPATLTSTFAHAAVTYAVKSLEAQQPATAVGPAELELSTLLIGTGWKALSGRDSVIAILRAVVHANDELARSPYNERVRIRAVTFIELYEDVALQAARALATAKGDANLAGRINASPVLQSIDGGRTRAFFAEQGSWWHRLQIVSPDNESLRFTLLTDRARAESTLQPTQLGLVDAFVARQITTTASDDALAVTLFELLVPNRLKEHAPEGRDIVLLLDSKAASYPWELMQDGGATINTTRDGADPYRLRLALRAGLIRQFQTETFRESVTNVTANSALVVGDPQSDPSKFPELLGAQREASAVADALSDGGYDVTALFRPRPGAGTIVQALFARSYKILHLAGHGVFDYDMPLTPEQQRRAKQGEAIEPRRVSGMVIGNAAFLTAAEIEQMRQVPEVVFVNCCHLGRMGGEDDPPMLNRNRLAAGLAEQLIRIGVKVVVAAGWSVDDGAAELFARTFYAQLLAGVPFGRAVLQARRATAREFPQSNTWGAYQCYGDYEFRLVNAASPSDAAAIDDFAGPTELVIALQNMTSDALTCSADELDGFNRRLDAFVAFLNRNRAAWAADARVCAAFGQTLGEFDRFDEAIAFYAKAMAAGRANLPVGAVEQYANLLTRAAVARWRQEGADGEASPAEAASAREVLRDPARSLWATENALAQIDEGTRILEGLLMIAKTPERLSIMGAAFKRRAIVASSAYERNAALRAMSQHYREAHELTASAHGKIDPYPLLNWLSAEACLHPEGIGDSMPAATENVLNSVDRQLAQDARTDFWGLVTRADLQLVRGLLAGKIDADDRQRLLDVYRAICVRAGSPRQLRSVIEHLEFIAEMYSSAKSPQARQLSAQLVLGARELRQLSGSPAIDTRAVADIVPQDMLRVFGHYTRLAAWDKIVNLAQSMPASVSNYGPIAMAVAYAYDRLGQSDSAIAQLRRYIERTGGDPDSHGLIASIFRRRHDDNGSADDLQNAINHFRAASTGDPENPLLARDLALLLQRAGSPDELSDLDLIEEARRVTTDRLGASALPDHREIEAALVLNVLACDWPNANASADMFVARRPETWAIDGVRRDLEAIAESFPQSDREQVRRILNTLRHGASSGERQEIEESSDA